MKIEPSNLKAAAIRGFVAERGLSYVGVARKTGLAYGTVYGLINGFSTEYRASSYEAILSAIGVTHEQVEMRMETLAHDRVESKA